MIYCVEDDKNILQMMIYTLKSAGYEVYGFEESTSFWRAVEKNRPDMVLLDIMLPGEDGMEILRKLRENEITQDVYIIMTTAKGSEYDRVIGLDSGADYYLVKPFGMMEMVAHVRAVMRRGKKITDKKTLRTGNLSLNLTRHTAEVAGQRIELTYKEYEILRILIENAGRVMSRDSIIEKVWGYDYIGESRTVDVHIGAIRRKLGECGDYIETVRGIGYKMEAME